jgi:hypothetical protein
MKLARVLEILLINAVLLLLLYFVTVNYSERFAYWGHEDFTPDMVRYPFFFITSATDGSTHIPGLLSVDWQQVVVVVLVLVDLVYYLSVVRTPKGQSVPSA